MLVTSDLKSTAIVVAALYSILLAYVAIGFSHLQRMSSVLNLRKLFAISCMLSCILRIIAFASMASINFAAHIDDDTIASHETVMSVFLEKTELILFDLPDFCFISAYLLLLIKWAEAFLLSRTHWLDSRSFRRAFMKAFVVFNVLLYSTQLCLCALLFVPTVNQQLLASAIYFTLAVINFGVPLLWVFTFVVLSFQFSGFPNASVQATQRYYSVSRICEVWTASRLIWAVLSLTTVLEGWLNSVKSSAGLKATLLVLVFVVLEMVPIFLAIYRLHVLVENEEDITTTQGHGPAEQPTYSYSYQRGHTWEEFEERQGLLGGGGISLTSNRSPGTLRDALRLGVLVDLGVPLLERGKNHMKQQDGGHNSSHLKRSYIGNQSPVPSVPYGLEFA